MSSNSRPFGSDTLIIPAYLADSDGTDDPGFERWKREHPDWFVAGHWTSGSRVRKRRAPQGDESVDRTRTDESYRRVLSVEALLNSFRATSLDPSTLSVADFLKAAAQAKAKAARSTSRAPVTEHYPSDTQDHSDFGPRLGSELPLRPSQSTSGIGSNDRNASLVRNLPF